MAGTATEFRVALEDARAHGEPFPQAWNTALDWVDHGWAEVLVQQPTRGDARS